MKTPLILAHRGMSHLACENTLEAFELTVQHKVDGIEFDIHLTKDQKLVVVHDHNLMRLAKVDKVVEQLTLEELQKFEVSTEYGKGKVPQLKDVFERFGTKLFYDIELKSETVKNGDFEQLVFDEIKKYKIENHCIVSSFNPFVMRKFNKISKRTIPSAIIYDDDPSVPPLLRKGWGRFICKVDFLKPNYQLIDDKTLKKGYPIITWTVDDVEVGNELLAKGVIALISNQPNIFFS